MPLGFERLNERQQRPNRWINFIKPLKGPDEATSLDFLQRVAAICRPICEDFHISIMSLEEYEPNREFVGRNFNNGEIIQLVLKSRSGNWLSFRFVQMVMIHEMAHCKQMNHSKAFWEIRDRYARELQFLWQKNYTGDGFWSEGFTLYKGQYTAATMPSMDSISASICGGMYRPRRKRKREKPKIIYAERKERHIKKRFGTGGVALGGDIETRKKLEDGKQISGQPRAKGARGRELRAAAALARFGKPTAAETDKNFEQSQDESQSEGEYDDPENQEAAADSHVAKMLDSTGRVMIKVHEANATSIEARREAAELGNIDQYIESRYHMKEQSHSSNTQERHNKLSVHSDLEKSAISDNDGPREKGQEESISCKPPNDSNKRNNCTSSMADVEGANSSSCSVCSLSNEANSVTCEACANVLDEKRLPGSWRCGGTTCAESLYINARNRTVCGACGRDRNFNP